MLTIVTGGSASGKSEFAEGLVTASENKNRLYIATMQVYDAEGENLFVRGDRMICAFNDRKTDEAVVCELTFS